MERRGLLESEWGVSENNRRAKYYALTEAGNARLAEEVTSWEAYVKVLAQVLSGPSPQRAP